MRITEKFKTIKIYAVFLVSVCFFLILINLLFYNYFVSIQQDEMYQQREHYFKKRDAGKGNVSNKNLQYANALKALKIFKKELPSSSLFADSIDKLNRVFHRDSLTISKMLFKVSKADSLGLFKCSTTLTISGNYLELKKVLADMQKEDEIFCVEELSFKKHLGGQSQIDMVLTIATYFK